MLPEKFKMMETESDVFHELRLNPYESGQTNTVLIFANTRSIITNNNHNSSPAPRPRNATHIEMTQMTQHTMVQPSNISLVRKIAIQQNRQHSIRNNQSFISPSQSIKSENL